MKEKILKAFKDLGFKLEEDEDLIYRFNYEELNMLYMFNESDELYLNIALPGIFEIEGDKLMQACILLEKINSTLKYVKAYIVGNSIWLFYERELIEQSDGQLLDNEEYLMTVISHMIFHLESGFVFAHKAMEELEEAIAKDSSDENSDDASEENVDKETTDNDDNE